MHDYSNESNRDTVCLYFGTTLRKHFIQTVSCRQTNSQPGVSKLHRCPNIKFIDFENVLFLYRIRYFAWWLRMVCFITEPSSSPSLVSFLEMKSNGIIKQFHAKAIVNIAVF